MVWSIARRAIHRLWRSGNPWQEFGSRSRRGCSKLQTTQDMFQFVSEASDTIGAPLKLREVFSHTASSMAILQRLYSPARAIALIASVAWAATATPSQAIMTYTLKQQDENTVSLEATGRLNLPLPLRVNDFNCDADGLAFLSYNLMICTGPARNLSTYRLSGPQFLPSVISGRVADSGSGISTIVDGGGGEFAIGPYASGDPISSLSVFNNATLEDFVPRGFAGLLATWTLEPANENDPYSSNDTIQFIVLPVPGPTPLLGAATAFGMSRRLRRKINLRRGTSARG